MASLKKPTINTRQPSFNSLYLNSNPLIDSKHNRSSSEGNPDNLVTPLGENNMIMKMKKPKVSDIVDDKENLIPNSSEFCAKRKITDRKLENFKDRAFKPSSLQLCIQLNEPDSNLGFGSKIYDPVDSESAKSVNVWDFSDSEAAPASSWSTLPNRALLCRALPVDVGRCTCIISKEAAPQGFGGGSIYSLFTNEGQGRHNRNLAVAYHKRSNGRSTFIIAQNTKGVLSTSDDSFIGVITANFMGSRYYIWDQGRSSRTLRKDSKVLQAVVQFTPTIATWTGSYRSIRAWIPKQQPSQLKNITNQGLPLDLEWEGNMDQVHLLLSRVPHYNKISKQYELEFREKVRAGLRIQSSVKNFQLTMEENGMQTILQLGRVEKSKYVLDFRHPLTGYQAFCICLASIDPKLCCTV